MKRQRTPKSRGATRKPAVRVGTAPHAPGESPDAQRQLRLPHERDQSTDATAPEPDPVIEQASRDLEAGQVDTDLRQTPGLDAERRRRLLRQQR